MSDSKNWRSIRSYGIILVRFINNYPEYLMVCRKSTYCYVDFLLGKYNDKNIEYLKFMVKNMTYFERMSITTKTYEQLWTELYSKSRAPTGAFYEYVSSKFEKTRDIFIVLNSSATCKYRHPEWGFPKGRPNHDEDPFDCASRELYEETRLDNSSYEIVRDILPFEERYVGTNGIGYRNVFFIGTAKNNCYAYLDRNNTAQIREIGYIKWLSYDKALRHFREHEESKRCVLEHVNTAILNYYNRFNIIPQPTISESSTPILQDTPIE